ncbi:hypothetical protein [Methanoregula sp.]|jgi:hypothetical protein|uniref:hypothetical protein n=1 Tax=Methanoregula sp. TaxID=2052170 RepID=UPI003C1AAA4E
MPTLNSIQKPTKQTTVNRRCIDTIPPMPTNAPKTGLDAVPVLGAIGLCGVIFLLWKN